MTDVFLFLQQGWKNIWKQNTIWLFGVLPFLSTLLRFGQRGNDSNFLGQFFYIIENLASIVLLIIYMIGVPFLVYSLAIGKPATVLETLSTIPKFIGRIIGCSCVGFLLFSPCFFVALVISSMNDTILPSSLSTPAVLIFLPISLAFVLWNFSLFGFFANDWGIRQNLKDAWTIFMDHFGTLAILGIIMAILFRMIYALSGVLTVLIQSGFEIASLSTLNYFNPSTTLSNSILFVVLNGIGQMIYAPVNASVFAAGYLKYSHRKTSSTARQK